MDTEMQRQAVAQAGRTLLEEGLVARTWGNVSCRTGEDGFVITPSGLSYEHMTQEDVVPYSMADGSWTGSRRPSSEKGIHAAAYRRFPEAGFVIHTHQVYATALGLAGLDRLSLSPEDREALGGLALAGYGLPGTKGLCKRVAAAMEGGAHTVLMAHHGALIVGRDREEAFFRSKLLEQVCKAACQGQPAGGTPAERVQGEALLQAASEAFPHAGLAASPPVAEAARLGVTLHAQLDDMAQMIGPRLITVPAERDAVLEALKARDAVLVRGVGGLCRAETPGDAAALCLLMEKACISFLHTRALGVKAVLSPLEAALMRRIYIQKYAKKIGG